MELKKFDNEYYYSLYPDVEQAVKNGAFKDGEHHYKAHGKTEGRQVIYIDNTPNIIDAQNPGWSNHLTLGDYVEPERKKDVDMVNVPDEFRVMHFEYPQGNKIPFEHYFFKKYNEIKPDVYRTYLPVFWTSYYVNNGYKSTKELQKFLNSLDKSKKYFTICQYDDGILDNVKGLDLLVYAMGSNKPGYYPIPLISQPLNNNHVAHLKNRDIEYSFIGKNTHPIREQLIKAFNNDTNTSYFDETLGRDIELTHRTLNPYIGFDELPIAEYYQILIRTKYALCPRGYGVTSFRMFEAMAYGCIPVYISDEFLEPFNIPFTLYGIKIKEDQIKDIPEIIKSANYQELYNNMCEIYVKYFVYSSCFNAIIKTL